MKDSIAWYEANAESIVMRYENIDAAAIHGWVESLLPAAPATVLDIGAGSGRDAAYFASKGYDVFAVEPSRQMRELGAKFHPHAEFQWIEDQLPLLANIFSYGLSFDIILLNAVWMHVAPSDQPRAFRKMINLLKPGGLLLMSLPQDHPEEERGFFMVSKEDVESLARNHGAYVERHLVSDDHCGRRELRWDNLAIRLPDDGSGALPLLRHIILNDNKSSTYKLALLRTLCRIADGAAGFSRDFDEDFVAVPFGLVALTWIRLFQPLLANKLPQNPLNVGLKQLEFAGDAFRQLADDSHHNLRIGMTYSGPLAPILHQALKDATNNIARMPATYITYPNGHAVFPVQRSGTIPRSRDIILNKEYLLGFGEILIPRHLWTALRRFDVWIEPSIVAEWCKLIKRYAHHQERHIDNAVLAAAMTWDEPRRDVNLARTRALSIMEIEPLFCIWSERRLTPNNLDIDHCLPWTAWPCGDLWNLMPTHRRVNQHQKRNKLPADRLFCQVQERLMEWWASAFTKNSTIISERFWLEAKSSLPSVPTQGDLDDVFDAVRIQGKRLKHDQQVPEWQATGYL